MRIQLSPAQKMTIVINNVAHHFEEGMTITCPKCGSAGVYEGKEGLALGLWEHFALGLPLEVTERPMDEETRELHESFGRVNFTKVEHDVVTTIEDIAEGRVK